MSGTDRILWLAELAIAIDEAQRLAWRLGVSEGCSADARELYCQLEELKAEVESLKQGQWSQLQADFDPNWMNLLSWGERTAGPSD